MYCATAQFVHRSTLAVGQLGYLAGVGASTNPCWVKFDGCTRSTSRAPIGQWLLEVRGTVRLVVPTSISRAPARRTISGMRTPPPISTSSPRLTAHPAAARET